MHLRSQEVQPPKWDPREVSGEAMSSHCLAGAWWGPGTTVGQQDQQSGGRAGHRLKDSRSGLNLLDATVPAHRHTCDDSDVEWLLLYSHLPNSLHALFFFFKPILTSNLGHIVTYKKCVFDLLPCFWHRIPKTLEIF